MKPKRRRKKPVEEPREQQVVFETVPGDPQEDETDEAVPSDYTLTQTDDSAAQQLRYEGPKPVEGEQSPERKRRVKKARRARRVVVALIVVLLGLFLFANREVLNLYTLRSFLNSIGITWFGESQVSSFELELDLSQTNLFDCYRDSLVVLSNSGLELTRLTGAPQYSETFHYSNPVLQVRDSKILTYDRGAKSLKTANGFGLDFELTTEYPILSAKMDDKGSFAVLTTSKNYKAQAMVYNSSNEAVYRWNSASSYISDISLDEDSHRLAIAGFNTGAGELSTTVTIIDYRSGEIVATGEPIDGLVAALDYNADGGLFAVTDDALYVLGPDGAQRGVYHFGDSTLSAASAELENGALLILSHHVAGTSLSMVGVDTFGKVMFEIALDSYVEDLAVSDKAILLLVNNRALLYNSSGELQNTISVSDDVRKVAVTSRQQALILELNEVTVVQ